MSDITRNLEKRLKESKDLNGYLSDNSSKMVLSNAARVLAELISESRFKKSEIIKKSGIAVSYAYEILNGFKVPTRDKIIRFMLALEVEFEDVQDVLKMCSYPMLYIRIKRDSVIIYAITNKLSVIDTNLLLEQHGLELI